MQQEEEKARRGKTDIDEFLRIPRFGIILYDAALCEKSDLDGMNTWLVPKHALDGLVEGEGQ